MTTSKFSTLTGYTPYSKRPDRCFVQGASGVLYPGVSVENISYPLSMTATQTAVCSCLGNEDQPRRIFSEQRMSPEFASYWENEFQLEVEYEPPGTGRVYDPLIATLENHHILDFLESLSSKSVAIHSGFPVAVLAETEKGFIPGVNVELTPWLLGLCAERVALARGIASGHRDFKKIHIYAPNGDFCTPCGACLQVLYELMPGRQVVLHQSDTSVSTHFVEQLLPYGFSSETLKTDHSDVL